MAAPREAARLPIGAAHAYRAALRAFAPPDGDGAAGYRLLDPFPAETGPAAKRAAEGQASAAGAGLHAYVYYLERYFGGDGASGTGEAGEARGATRDLRDALTRVPAVAVDGDRYIETQKGETAHSYIEAQRLAGGLLLSYHERKRARKKLVGTWSLVRKVGGYPDAAGPARVLAAPFMCGIVSAAGAQFELPELEASLFLSWPAACAGPPDPHEWPAVTRAIDPHDKEDDRVFGHLYAGGRKPPPSTGAETFELLREPFFRSAIEDWTLVLTAASDLARRVATAARPKALVKLTAVGLGFFARRFAAPSEKRGAAEDDDGDGAAGERDADDAGERDLAPQLAPVLLDALHAVLSRSHFPHIGRIELPDFFPTRLWTPPWVSEAAGGVAKLGPGAGVEVRAPHPPRDVLPFSAEELAAWVPVVLNPGDVFCIVGNEREYGSVEAMIGNNTTARRDSSYQHNAWLLAAARHLAVVSPRFD